MPDSGPVPLPDVQGWLTGAALAAAVVTPMVSLLLLGWYRRVVTARMTTGAPAVGSRRWGSGQWRPAPRAAATPTPEPTARRPARPATLTELVRRQRRSLLAWHALAAVAYGLIGSLALLTETDTLTVPRLLVVTLLYAWPWVPTAVLVLGLRARQAVLLTAGYFLALVAAGSMGTASLRGGVLAFAAWALMAGPATVLMAAFAAPRLRAAAPHVALVVFSVAAGLFVWPWTAYSALTAGSSFGLSVLLGVTLPLLMIPLAVANLAWSARRYATKRASEQSLAIDQWWLIFTLAQCLMQYNQVRAWFAMLGAHLAHRLVMALGRRRLGRAVAGHAGPQLLLLRVFARRRGEQVLRDLNATWCHAGSVHLIAGWDLATATMGPDEFLDFTLGRLSRHFVTDQGHLARRLAELDLAPDGDGRHRVNDFFCYRDTWQPAVRALVERADVVLVDLRGLTPRNEGVTFELQYLVHCRALHRVVALIDDTTDLAHVHWALDSAARGASRWLNAVRVEDDITAMELLHRITAASSDGSAVLELTRASTSDPV